jgi:hypothetical protein
MTMKKTLPEKNLLSLSFLGYEEIKFKRFLSGRLCIMVKKKLIDYFKCVYFLLSRAPFGRSHYLAPVALGFLIMRKIFLVGNLFLLTCPSPVSAGQSTLLFCFRACVGLFFHLPMVSTRPGDYSGLFSYPQPTSTYILVRWVGNEPMTLKIGTSSPTTWPVFLQHGQLFC